MNLKYNIASLDSENQFKILKILFSRPSLDLVNKVQTLDFVNRVYQTQFRSCKPAEPDLIL